jgi:hypothetical protein
MNTTHEQPATNQLKRSLAGFLESIPPGAQESIPELFTRTAQGNWIVAKPDIQLHCSSVKCEGVRSFRCASDSIYAADGKLWKYGYATYECRNCQNVRKIYAISVLKDGEPGPSGTAYKFGEYPPFGPPTPARVIHLIGPDRELYLQGRRAENQGFGIGAYAYYRRVVENQKGRIIREMGRVAKKLGAPAAVIIDFEAAASETQFSTAIDRIKSGIPSTLLMNGHNPLSLLHTALSEGLHEQHDAACLELATSIRLVLTELAERMSQALKDEAELGQAVSRLLSRKSDTFASDRTMKLVESATGT